MSLLKEVLSWGKSLPPWQGDAIGRLFKKGELSPEDLDDLYALLKSEHGIPDPEGRSPNPLTDADIPAGSQQHKNMVLVAIKNLINVNAIAEKQKLNIGSKGLTVVYGGNGSGKSGYSRVLKKACRARDQSEKILPNANNKKPVGNAQAEFEVSVNGVTSNLVWEEGMVAPEQLSSLAIFDSRCARAYLDEEDDFSYVPYGLDIMEGLAGLCRQLQGRITSQKAACSVDKTVFGDLFTSQTAAGKLVQQLSANTKVTDIEKLTNLGADEITRREQLGKSLKADNPAEKSKQFEIAAARIEKLANNVSQKQEAVNSNALTTLKNLSEAYHVAKNAAEISAKNFEQGKSFLAGTGSEVWKELFDAARRFAKEAYPGKQFPNLDADDPCPLCQESLEGGLERLKSFDEFVRNEAESKMRACRKVLADKYKPFEAFSMGLGCDEPLYKEIEGLEQPLATAIRDFEKSLVARHKAIVGACKDRKWDAVPNEPESPAERLKVLAERLRKESIDLLEAADATAREVLQNELDELDARSALSKLKKITIDAVEKYALAARLSCCMTAVKTNSITIKANDLAEKVVNKDLADALNTEFKAIGAAGLHVSLTTRGVKGKTLHKLRLDLPRAKRPIDILSEGEQRAIALGSFLAEVSIGGGTGGIVFDDPVSSLDHQRRDRVASRLAQEAAKRQVIILTHDVYFLCILMEKASRLGVPILAQSLTKKPKGFGVAVAELPFEGMGTKARVGALRDLHQRIMKLHKDGDDLAFRKETSACYRLLRIAWERAVEEVLFQSVILRFRKGVETNRLISVVVEDSDYHLIEASMTKCSNYEHDQALMGGTHIPEPDELLEDINSLSEWRLAVQKRADSVSKQRKEIGK